MSFCNDLRELFCYEWVVERPVLNRPRYSPEITINGDKISLKFSWSSCYKITLFQQKQAWSTECSIHVFDSKKRKLLLPSQEGTVKSEDYNCVWCYTANEILQEVPEFLGTGLLTFFVIFRFARKRDMDFPFQMSTGNNIPRNMMNRSVQDSDNGGMKPIQISGCMDLPCLICQDFFSCCLCGNPISCETLSDNLDNLLEQDQPPDVELLCGAHKIMAHKNVLATQSKVLQAMITTREEVTDSCIVDQITLQPMDQEVFEHFVKFLYSGKLPDLTVETARRFYEVGNKYAVGSLVKQSARFLKENLQLENACEMLVLADSYGDQEFVESVTDCVMRDFIRLHSGRWLHFSEIHPLLAVRVMHRLLVPIREELRDAIYMRKTSTPF